MLTTQSLKGSQSGGLFSGLMNQKRNSTDAAANARRQSFAEQKPAPGVIGKMWNKYVDMSPNRTCSSRMETNTLW